MCARPQRPSRGVTLIELVVALAILGIALAAMLPEAGAWMRGLAVRNAAESMRAGLERARMEALRRNTSVSFWLVSDACALSTTGPSWAVSVLDPSDHCSATPSTSDSPMLVEYWSASDGAKGVQVAGIDSAGSATSSVTFNSLGQVLSSGSQLAQIDLSHTVTGTRALRVRIEAGGSVRMCDPNVDADDPRKC
jgi:type IV fimbrial biogenesis protein FimT